MSIPPEEIKALLGSSLITTRRPKRKSIDRPLTEVRRSMRAIQIAEQAARQMAQIYAVEREVKDLSSEERLHIRQDKSEPLVQTFYEWLVQSRQKVPEGSATATANAIDYSLRRWRALTRFLEDVQLLVTTTGSRTKSGQLRLAGTTGYLRVRCVVDKERRRP